MSQEHCEQFAEALTKPRYKKLSQQRFLADYNNHISSLCICTGAITFSISAKAFINFQETILKSICVLVTNCKQEHRKDLNCMCVENCVRRH